MTPEQFPRFVLLQHVMPPGADKATHLDLMLETGHSLRTWSLVRWPDANETVPAEVLPPHRLAYLDYEGPVSGHRGWVRRRDRGTHEILHESTNTLRVRLSGDQIRGVVTLTRIDGQWHLAFDPQACDTV